MAVARPGLCRQIGDAPGAFRFAKQGPQDRCRLRGEDRAQRTGLRDGPLRHGALYVNGVECEPRVPDQIEIGGVVVQADGAGFRRQVKTDDHWNEAPAATCFARLAQTGDAALEPIDPGTDEARGAVRPRLDDECIVAAAVGKCDQSVHAWSWPIFRSCSTNSTWTPGTARSKSRTASTAWISTYFTGSALFIIR